MSPAFRLVIRTMTAIALVLAFAGLWRDAHAAGTPQTPWNASYFPNVPLFTQDGKKVHFFDDLIKGKVVAINFIFTNCSASCSMETARLRDVAELLGDRMGKDVFFYSISIDPDNDTPEALKAYAKKFNIGPGWTFLTGRIQDVDLLREKLGLYMPQLEAGQNKNDHDLSLVIGNQATGRWMKASPFENPDILATQLGSWLSNWKLPTTQDTYANAPVHLKQMSRGEELYRTRCASCHSVGAPAGSLAALRAIGPDLGAVTKTRDHVWLTRWLKEPDVMLAEKDPIAVALFAKYNKLPMPNLKLKQVEIEELIKFLDERSTPAAAGKVAHQ